MFTPTLNNADVLTGSGENASLTVVAENIAVNAGAVTMSGITTANIKALGNNVVFGGSNVTDLTTVNNTDSINTVGVTGQTKFENVSLSNTAAGTTVTAAATALSGTDDAITLTLDGTRAGTTFAANATGTGRNGYEILNVVSQGSASSLTSVTLGNSTRATYNFTGDQNVSVTGAAAVAANAVSVDASEMTGNLSLGSVTITGAGVGTVNSFATNATGVGAINIKGGQGNDGFVISDLSNKYVIDGGEGTDRVTFDGTANIATSPTITNVEELRFTDDTGGSLGLGAGAVNANLVNVTGVDKFLLDGSSTKANTGVLTLNNSALAAGGTTFQFTGDGQAASQTFNGVSFNPTGAGGGSDSVAITIGNGGVAVGTGNNYTVGALTLTGIENVTVTASDMASGNNLNMAGFGTAIQTFAATTAGNLSLTDSVLGAAGAATGSITNANFSGVSGAVTNGAGAAVFIDNAANASITLAGSGNHIVRLEAITPNAGNINAASASGNVTLTGAGADDIITGGSGNDIITGGAGVDSLTGGVGADRFVQNNGDGAAATAFGAVVGGAQVITITTDVVTDFSSAQGDVLKGDGTALTAAGLQTLAGVLAGGTGQYLVQGTYAAGSFTANAVGQDIMYADVTVAAGAISGVGTDAIILVGAVSDFAAATNFVA